MAAARPAATGCAADLLCPPCGRARAGRLAMDDHWSSVAAYADRPSAEAVRARLSGESVPCYIASNEHVPGLGTDFAVRVPARLLQQARWILEQGRVSDSELTELALKQPPEGSPEA